MTPGGTAELLVEESGVFGVAAIISLISYL